MEVSTVDPGTILSVRRAIRDCRKCDLRRTASQPVPWRGDLHPDLLVIGEAPGEREDHLGEPFVGPAGILLVQKLMESGIHHVAKIAYANSCQCVAPGTNVSTATAPRVGFKRRYRGEFLTLRTALGNEVTVTPNHPILTPHGWRGADQLRPGDNLVYSPTLKWVTLGEPHVKGPPTPIDEVFDSLANPGVRQGVAGANVDFHGDGSQGQVEVVGLNRNLLLEGQSPSPQFPQEGDFFSTNDFLLIGRTLRAGHESSFNFPFGPLASAHSVMGGFSHVQTVLGADEFEANFHGLLARSNRDSVKPQTGSYRIWNKPQTLTDTFASLPGEITLDNLVEVRNHFVDTHVFNLSTQEGWYAAEGIITHNCYPNRGLSPTQDIHYIDTCRQWMRSQVALLQPQFVLTVGQVAFRSVWGDLTWPTLLQLHGKPLYWPDAPAPANPTAVFATYHPSSALPRSASHARYKRIIKEDLFAMKAWVDAGEKWPTEDSEFDCYCCGMEATGWDPDGRGIALCDLHRIHQGELELAT